MEKKVILIGGASTQIWGKQYHQQDRVYSTKGLGAAINAMGNNGLVIKRWKRKS